MTVTEARRRMVSIHSRQVSAGRHWAVKVARSLRYCLVMRERQKWGLLILSVLVSYRSLPFRIKRREPSIKSTVTIGSRTIHHTR